MNKKTAGAFVVVIIIVVGGWYILSGHAANKSGTAIVGTNEIVATVNDTSITRSQLTASESQLATEQGAVATSTVVQAQFQSEALDLLISQILVKQAAAQAGITASSTEVDAQFSSIKSQFNTASDYKQALAAKGMTEDELHTQISDNNLINRYLEQQLKLSTMTATNAEIVDAYNSVASEQQGKALPPLDRVRAQVAQMVVQEKQQKSVNAYLMQLRSAANIQILIATSTPA